MENFLRILELLGAKEWRIAAVDEIKSKINNLEVYIRGIELCEKFSIVYGDNKIKPYFE